MSVSFSAWTTAGSARTFSSSALVSQRYDADSSTFALCANVSSKYASRERRGAPEELERLLPLPLADVVVPVRQVVHKQETVRRTTYLAFSPWIRRSMA